MLSYHEFEPTPFNISKEELLKDVITVKILQFPTKTIK